MTNSDQCHISTQMLAGWRAVILENDLLQLTILPDKGADIYSFIHKPTGIDFLFKAPWQLQPPQSPPRAGSGDMEFLWNYEGGWQELFPNVNEACTYEGRPIPFHGEVATLAWTDQIVYADPDKIAVQFSVRCRQTPFRLERIMRLQRGEPSVVLEEKVINESDTTAHFVWGHHCVVGPPFLEAGCQLKTPAQTIVTPPEPYEQTARLQPNQQELWPMARLRDGDLVDLRQVPGPEAGSHDDVYLTNLTAGWVAVTNPRLELTFSLDWDPAIFRWLVVWQPYGGAQAMPLTGIYALGIEPWSGGLNLEQAVTAGEAIELAGGASFEATVRATIGYEVEAPSASRSTSAWRITGL